MTAPQSSSSNVRVVARIRPLAKYELENGSKETVTSLNSLDDSSSSSSSNSNEPELIQALPLSGKKRWFELDAVFDKSSTQEDVYIRSGAKQSVCEDIFKGFNCTILAYGQTGAGKTYSMGSAFCNTVDESSGMIPRACCDLFSAIDEKCDGNAQVQLSYLEIYNEELRDLMTEGGSSNSKNLRIRENLNGEVYVSGLQSRLVTSPQEIGALMETASKRRVVGSTAMNAVSSRSHAMCVLQVKGVFETETGSDKFESKLTLVDLAGSERIKKTAAQGNRQKEGININKSLLVLGQVVAALSEQHKKHARKPPYRDSKLTRLLQDSLGGNSRTIMVACVSPADFNIEESINTLRYATSARNIKNTATRNIVKNITPEEAAKLQRENQLLKKEVEELQRTLRLMTTEPQSRPPISKTVSFDSEISAVSNCGDDDDSKRIRSLESEIESLKTELAESKAAFRQTADQSITELPALKMEVEQLREEVKEVGKLEQENRDLQQELEEVKADAQASQRAASKLSNIMDKLQELKGDELDKKRMEYEHTKKEESWVCFLSQILATRKDQMKRLGDDFDLVVRVVESPAIMQTPSTTMDQEQPAPDRRRWLTGVLGRNNVPDGDPVQLRQQLLTQHVNFFNEKMEEITRSITVEAESLKEIRSSLRSNREKLELEIGMDEFVKDSLNSGDEALLRQLQNVLIGPVQSV